MKKKQGSSKRGHVNLKGSSRHGLPIVYVDVEDGIFRSSIGGDKIPLERMRKTRACVNPRFNSTLPAVQVKRARAGVSIAEARRLSAVIAEKTGFSISANEIIHGIQRIQRIQKVYGIYPPLGIVKNGEVIEIIKSFK